MSIINESLFYSDIEVNEFNSYKESQIILEELKGMQKASKKVDDVVKGIIKTIKSLHTTSDENLVEKMPEFSKIITRVAIVKVSFLVNPLLGLITTITTLVLKQKNDQAKRDKLIRMYTSKLEFINDKIEKEDEDEEKRRLMKIRDKLRSDIEKLKAFKDDD